MFNRPLEVQWSLAADALRVRGPQIVMGLDPFFGEGISGVDVLKCEPVVFDRPLEVFLPIAMDSKPVRGPQTVLGSGPFFGEGVPGVDLECLPVVLDGLFEVQGPLALDARRRGESESELGSGPLFGGGVPGIDLEGELEVFDGLFEVQDPLALDAPPIGESEIELGFLPIVRGRRPGYRPRGRVGSVRWPVRGCASARRTTLSPKYRLPRAREATVGNSRPANREALHYPGWSCEAGPLARPLPPAVALGVLSVLDSPSSFEGGRRQ